MFDVEMAARVYLAGVVSRVAARLHSWPDPAILNEAAEMEAAGLLVLDEVLGQLGLEFGFSESAAYSGKLDFVTFEIGYTAAQGNQGWDLMRTVARQCPPWAPIVSVVAVEMFENWASEERVSAVTDEVRAEITANATFREMVLTAWNLPPTIEEILGELRVQGAG